MPSVFAITGSGTEVTGKGELSFTVTNTSDRPIRGRADLLTPENAKPPYLSITGSAYRDFVVKGTHQFTVKVDPPAGAPASTHTARLRMIDDEHPEEVSVDGPTFTYAILPPPPKKFPLWIPVVAIAVVVLISVGIAAYVFWPRNPTVPELIGLTLDQAQAEIETQKFTLGELSDQISDRTPGTVIDQNPKPANQAAEGAPIDLIVALAPPPPAPVPVPNVIGKSQEEAKGLIESAGLKIGALKDSASYAYAPGKIADTSPKANAQVARDSAVTLVLAKEPAVHARGEFTLSQNRSADFDLGTTVDDDSNTGDIRFRADGTTRAIEPRNDAKLLRMGTSAPGAAGCATAKLGTNAISVTQLPAGAHLCVLTKQGRLADVRVVTAAGPSQSSMRLDFTTYVPQFGVYKVVPELVPFLKP